MKNKSISHILTEVSVLESRTASLRERVTRDFGISKKSLGISLGVSFLEKRMGEIKKDLSALVDYIPRCERYMDFNEARELVRIVAKKHYLATVADWLVWCHGGEKPDNIPAHPERKYAGKGWVSWMDWLGSARAYRKVQIKRQRYVNWREFKEAREFVRSLGLANTMAWKEWCVSGNRPFDIPSNPHVVYARAGWVGSGDWLGTNNGRGRPRRTLRMDEPSVQSSEKTTPDVIRVAVVAG